MILQIEKYNNDPHLSALTESLLERRIKIISKNIKAIRENKKLINVVHNE